MGSGLAKPSNKSMVDRLVEGHSYITSPQVEGAFRAVDRAMYFLLEDDEDLSPYDDDPWRKGNLHISAPCIYAKVVEALDLKPGLSFLNLGSGTGYLNTIVGLLIGPNGVNHGIEIHSDVVEYAYRRLQQFKQKSYAIDKFDFAEPMFVQGNCLNLNPNVRYDRIYLGAACLPEMEVFMKKLIKPDGGVLVMPYEQQLLKHIRVGEQDWRTEKLMDVNFTLMMGRNTDPMSDPEATFSMPLPIVKSLKELSRIAIRRKLRQKTERTHPDLLNSDNIAARRYRKAVHRQKMARIKQESEVRKRILKSKLQCMKGRSTTNEAATSDNASSSCAPSSSRPSDFSEAYTNAPSGRILTRSASRRLGTNKKVIASTSNNSSSSHQCDHSVTTQTSLCYDDESEVNSNESDSEESDEDRNHQEVGRNDRSTRQDCTPTQNCARSRPYVQSSGNKARANLSLLFGQNPRRTGTGSNFHFPVQVDPSSSSSSDNEEFPDAQDLREFGQVRRHLLMNWPSSWGSNQIRINAPGTGPSTSELSNMSDDSDYILNELDNDINEEDDWESAHSSSSDFTINDYNSRVDETEDGQTSSSNNLQAGSCSGSRSATRRQLRPSQSLLRPVTSTGGDLNIPPSGSSISVASQTIESITPSNVIVEKSTEQEPVASRLRSRSRDQNQAESSTITGQGEHSVPGCSNNASSSSKACPIHKRRMHTCSHVHHHRHSICRHRYSRHVHQNCLNPLRRHRSIKTQKNQQQTSSRGNRPGNSSASTIVDSGGVSRYNMGDRIQERETTAGSSNIFAQSRANNDSIARKSNQTCIVCKRQRSCGQRRPHSQVQKKVNHRQQQAPHPLDKKRKHQSSSESLESSNSSSPTSSNFRHRSSRLRSFCTCLPLPTSSRPKSLLQTSVAGSSNGHSFPCEANSLHRVGIRTGGSMPNQNSMTSNRVSSSVSRSSTGTSSSSSRLHFIRRMHRMRSQQEVAIERVDRYMDSFMNHRRSGPNPNLLAGHRVGNDHFRSLSSRIDRFESIFREHFNAPISSRSMNNLIGVNLRPHRAHQLHPLEPPINQQLRILRPRIMPNVMRDMDIARRQAQSLSSGLEWRKRERSQNDECRQYHSLIIEYIKQLPLPRVLHDYLNYDRSL